MTQYWEIKKTNFDKLLLFKLGKFYEIFYNDAIICQKLLDLNWMGGARKLHVGFPEKALDKYLSTMVNSGYKVAVVEQTETPKELERRMRASNWNTKYKQERCVKREVCNVVTRGTFKDPKDTGYLPKYLLSLKKYTQDFGVCFFDVATLKFHIGQFRDDEQMTNFRTLIS